MSIKRRYIKHGDLLEIPLKNLGSFGYLKAIDPLKIADPRNLPCFARVYNFTSGFHLENPNDVNREMLMAPFYLAGQSSAITKFNWRIVANEDVDIDEEWIPDTKRSFPLFSQEPTSWYYLKRFNVQDMYETSFEKVKHLDEASGKNIEIVPFLIELELLKLQDRDIRQEFGCKSWHEEAVYKIHSKLPAYSKLPKRIQGRADV